MLQTILLIVIMLYILEQWRQNEANKRNEAKLYAQKYVVRCNWPTYGK